MAIDERFRATLEDSKQIRLYEQIASIDKTERKNFFDSLNKNDKSLIKKVQGKKRVFDRGGATFNKGNPYEGAKDLASSAFTLGKLPNNPDLQVRALKKQFGAENAKLVGKKPFLRGPDNNFYPAIPQGDIGGFGPRGGGAFFDGDVNASDAFETIFTGVKTGKLSFEVLSTAVGGLVGGATGTLGAAIQGAKLGSDLGAQFGTGGSIAGGALGAAGGFATGAAGGTVTGAGLGAEFGKQAVDGFGLNEALKLGIITESELKDLKEKGVEDSRLAGLFGALGQGASKVLAPGLKKVQIEQLKRGAGKALTSEIDSAGQSVINNTKGTFLKESEKLGTQFKGRLDEVDSLYREANKRFGYDSDKHIFTKGSQVGNEGFPGINTTTGIKVDDLMQTLDGLPNGDLKNQLFNIMNTQGTSSARPISSFSQIKTLDPPRLYLLRRTLNSTSQFGDVNPRTINEFIIPKIDKQLPESFKKANKSFEQLNTEFGRFGTNTEQAAKVTRLASDIEKGKGSEASASLIRPSANTKPESKRLLQNLLDDTSKGNLKDAEFGELLNQKSTTKGSFNIGLSNEGSSLSKEIAEGNFDTASKSLESNPFRIQNITSKGPLKSIKDVLQQNQVENELIDASFANRDPLKRNFNLGSVNNEVGKKFSQIEQLIGSQSADDLAGKVSSQTNQFNQANNLLKESANSTASQSFLEKAFPAEIGKGIARTSGLTADLLDAFGQPTANFLRSASFSNPALQKRRLRGGINFTEGTDRR